MIPDVTRGADGDENGSVALYERNTAGTGIAVHEFS